MKEVVCGFKMFVTVGFYEAGDFDPAEVFCSIAKHGSEIFGLIDATCILISISLQYGVPWPKIRDRFRYTKFGATDLYNKSLLDGLVQMVDRAIEHRGGPPAKPPVGGEVATK